MSPTEQAKAFLNRIRQEHSERLYHDRIKNAEAPFLYGQDFEVEPEIWDYPEDDITERDLRNL